MAIFDDAFGGVRGTVIATSSRMSKGYSDTEQAAFYAAFYAAFMATRADKPLAEITALCNNAWNEYIFMGK